MPKHKEYYEVSKEQAKYMSATKIQPNVAELEHIARKTVNIEYRAEACAAENAALRIQKERSEIICVETGRSTPHSNGIYENLTYHRNYNLQNDYGLSKNLILNKFFRSTERNYAAYENLCSGCGYGVFEARGRLCHFCQYVVHGVYERRASKEEEDSNGNIYENICDKCATIYSSEECECCLAERQTPEQIIAQPEIKYEQFEHIEPTKPKNSKNKREKKSLFHGLIGSLRRVKSNLTPPETPNPRDSPGTRKRLEIVHNVEGYDNVFRTQESFDLDKICELKRTQNSCSDQHIYGRLKLQPQAQLVSHTLPATYSQSHDQLARDQQWQPIDTLEPQQVASADCISGTGTSVYPTQAQANKSSGKRPRISKPRLLRSRSQHKNNTSAINGSLATPVKQSLYLADSVCQWMTSLRREIHYYQSFVLADDIALCDPKSIPAKQTLTYGQICYGGAKHWAPANLLTNYNSIDKANLNQNLDKPYSYSNKNSVGSDDNIDSNLIKCDNEFVTLRRANKVGTGCEAARSAVGLTLLQQMVEDFKRNLMSKQLQEREAAAADSTPTTPTSTTSNRRISPTSAQQRAKRQAIYLKLDECNSNENDNENNNNADHTDAKLNYTSKQQSQLKATAASQLACEHGLASRRIAVQPITASNKRCGIYERDSEFVNDILCAFEQFLQREADTASADVVAKCEPIREHTQPNAAAELKQTNVTAINGNSEVVINQSDPNVLNQQQVSVFGDRNVVQPYVGVAKTTNNDRTTAFEQIFNVSELISNLLLSRCLNSIVVCYDKPLSAFLRCLSDREDYRARYLNWKPARLVRKYQRFISYCQPTPTLMNAQDQSSRVGISKNLERVCESTEQKASRKVNASVVGVNDSAAANCIRTEVNVKRENVDATSSESASSVLCDQIAAVSSVEVAKVNKSAVTECEEVVEISSSENATLSKCVEIEESLSGQCGGFIKASVSVQSEEINSEQQSFECVTNQIEACSQRLGQDKINLKEESDVYAKVTDRENRTTEYAKDAHFAPIPQISKVPNRKASLKDYRKTPKKLIKPQVPQRDPTTCISQTIVATPPRPAKRESPTAQDNANKMTVPTTNTNATNTHSKLTTPNNNNNAEEEDIYQPIWKFKTVGEVQERYHTDADYYEYGNGVGVGVGAASKSPHDSSTNAAAPAILISTNVEDHGEWETDDEFMFTTQLEECIAEPNEDAMSQNSSTVRSMHSMHSMRSTRSGSSNTGSTVTGYASSTMTIASAVSTSLMHHLFRNIGIYYSLSEPKLRAIIYDYDRVFATSYFAKRQAVMEEAASGTDKSMSVGAAKQECLPVPPPRTTSASSQTKASNSPGTKRNFPGGESVAANVGCQPARALPKLHVLPDSVQAWKFMLLDVNYVEDEEDMIVSESEILRAQENKDDIDTRQNQQLHFLQRFKSASIGNLIDIPTEEDKKSITERMRNKLQRGVFKLNVRSPKSEKKSRGIFRRAEATSLYLEDGMKPKYPIFGAPLDDLELNQSTQPNVPRFVVDCVEYIERKDCIQQDGLYRASGNKVSIDELKQKLSESYIYDPKLLVCDDIHTLTSLLKQFFRELGAPLIPQETYERLGRNLTDEAAIETLKSAFDEMREPNRSTLKFLIQHLTNVATHSSENRMPASNLAIVWGPCILSANQIEYDIARMNTLAKVLIENHYRIFAENERLVC